MPVLLLIVIAVIAVAVGGVLAAASAAMSVLSRAEILALASGSRARRWLQAISGDMRRHVSAVIFVRDASNVTAVVLVTIAVVSLTNQWWLAIVCVCICMTFALFVVVSTIALSVGRDHAQSTLRWTSIVVHVLSAMVGALAGKLANIGNRLPFGESRPRGVPSETQLLNMVDEATEFNVLAEDDRERIHSILRFNDTVVREVMVPRTDMVTIEAGASIGSAMAVFFSKNVSRIPVIDGDIDKVHGILYLRDVAKRIYEMPADIDARVVGELAQRALFVPESKHADDMLTQMQTESNHLAVVVDEYGGISGLVTLEDLIEELVGDIFDEYDRGVVGQEDLGGGRFRVNAGLSLGDLGGLFNIVLEDDDVDSVGGLLTKSLGRLPAPGASAKAMGFLLTAERSDGRPGRIRTVVVERDHDTNEAGDMTERRIK